MGSPYIGEIRMFGGNFAPNGWAFCNGQLVAISENDALFNLIGTTYGGDGQVTFALPDLRGRLPVHQGTGPGLPTATYMLPPIYRHIEVAAKAARSFHFCSSTPRTKSHPAVPITPTIAKSTTTTNACEPNGGQR